MNEHGFPSGCVNTDALEPHLELVPGHQDARHPQLETSAEYPRASTAELPRSCPGRQERRHRHDSSHSDSSLSASSTITSSSLLFDSLPLNSPVRDNFEISGEDIRAFLDECFLPSEALDSGAFVNYRSTTADGLKQDGHIEGLYFSDLSLPSLIYSQ